MRNRASLIASVAAATALLAPAAAAAELPAPASVSVVRCDRQAASGLPAGEYQGRMGAVTGTYRMSMRFDLQERVGAGPWTTVHSSPLKAWRRSHAGVRSFTYRQRVENLHPEAAYRVLVHFRWFDRAGRAIRVRDRNSGACPATAPILPAEPAPPA